MTEEQRLFLVQAKSAYAVYKLLNADKSLHHCHALHYLQMATELLGKASAWKNGPSGKSHKALVPFLRSLSSNPKAQRRLGYEGQHENWEHTIRKITPMAESLQKMAPALAGNGPNPEYPWPPDAPTNTPVEYAFPIWEELTETSYGARWFRLSTISSRWRKSTCDRSARFEKKGDIHHSDKCPNKPIGKTAIELFVAGSGL